jgi:hypothetical protein
MTKKRLGDPRQQTCEICGRILKAHATTIALIWSNHRKAHERRGEAHKRGA